MTNPTFNDVAKRRWPLFLAGALCFAFLVGALRYTAHGNGLTTDGLYSALVARNLAHGHGYTIDVIGIHPGFYDSVRHIPEQHGLLRPVVLAPLFGLFGVDPSLARVPGFAYLALTGFLAFVFARTLFGAAAGFIACVLTLGSDVLFRWAWAGTDDIGFAFFFVFSLYVLYLGLARRNLAFFAMAGLVAGIGLLEKLSGLFMPLVFLAPLVCLRELPRVERLRMTALLFAPFLLCVGVYLVRNQLAYGSFMFRFSPLEWIWKVEGYRGAFVLFDPPPTLIETLHHLGAERILRAVGEQFAHAFALGWPGRGSLTTPWFLSGLALTGWPLLLFNHRNFGILCLLGIAGSLLFTCVLYHVETRYFSMLIPLFAIMFSGVVAYGIQSAGSRSARVFVRGCSVACLLLVLATGAVAFARSATLAAHRIALRRTGWVCDDAAAWIERQVGIDEPILTIHPLPVAWVTGRPVVMAPSGGREPIGRVARHYGARWLLRQPRVWGFQDAAAGLANVIASPGTDIRATLAFDGGRCDVYRLGWSAERSGVKARK